MRPFVFLQSAHFSAVAVMWRPKRSVSEQRFLWKLLPCNSTILHSYRVVTSPYDCSFSWARCMSSNATFCSPFYCVLSGCFFRLLKDIMRSLFWSCNCGVIVSCMRAEGKLCFSVWFHTQTPFSFHIQSQLQFSLRYLAKHWPLGSLSLFSLYSCHHATFHPFSLSRLHVEPASPLSLTTTDPCQLGCTSPQGCKVEEGFSFFYTSSPRCWESPVPTYIMSHQLRHQAGPQTLEGIICHLRS